MKMFFLGLICLISVPGCVAQNLPCQEMRLGMGTYITIKINDTDKALLEKKRAADEAFAEMKRLEGLLSSFKKDSTVSKINSAGTKEVLLDNDTFFVLERARYFYEVSGGAFDITVLPLLELWGFHDTERRVPSDEEIRETLKRVGSDKMALDRTKKSVRFLVPGMKIDLGAIATGFIVDMGVLKLKTAGIQNALVDAGGDIYVIGRRTRGARWSIGIRDPFKRSRLIEKRQLEDEAIVTSGDYENYFEVEGKRYSHIMDPRTGRPAENGVASVTVTYKDCLTADALATAIFVLGEKDGKALADGIGCGAKIVSK